MKAILVIDVDNIDIENTQATYIELQCNSQTKQISLINHWLKPMPKELEPAISEKYVDYCQGFNDCIDEILGETE